MSSHDKRASLQPEISLQPHQQRVVDRARSGQNRLLLYHGLGSGKSLSSIAAAEALGGDYAVVAPASLRQNFDKELKKFTTGSDPDVLSYTGVALGKKPKRKPRSLVFDEVQRLINENSASTVRSLRLANEAQNVFLLSGTPIVNNPTDLAPLLSMLHGKVIPKKKFEEMFIGDKIVKPGVLGRLRGVKPGVVSTIKNEGRLRSMLRGHVDYQPGRTPDGVRVDEKIVTVPMSAKQQAIQRALYDKLPPEWRWKFNKEFPLSPEELRSLTSFLVGYRQIGLSTLPFRGDRDALKAFADSAKLQKAYADLRETLDSDPRKKAIIYSNFIGAGIEPYAAKLKEDSVPYGVFHGGVPLAERKRVLDEFDAGKLRALLLGPAAAEGISTKGTSLIQLLDPHWHESRTSQARGRGLRFDSHLGLEDELKNVAVRHYLSTSQEPSALTKIIGKKRVRTGDEIVQTVAKRKEELNELFRQILREEGQEKRAISPLVWRGLAGTVIGGAIGAINDHRPPAESSDDASHLAAMKQRGLDVKNPYHRRWYAHEVENRGISPILSTAAVGGMLGAITALQRKPRRSGLSPRQTSSTSSETDRGSSAKVISTSLAEQLPAGYLKGAKRHAEAYRNSESGSGVPFSQDLSDKSLHKKVEVRNDSNIVLEGDDSDQAVAGVYETMPGKPGRGSITMNTSVAVPGSALYQRSLAHELTHATQNPDTIEGIQNVQRARAKPIKEVIQPTFDFLHRRGYSAGDLLNLIPYLGTREETEAYLANIKRDYFRETGRHITNQEDAAKMWEWFKDSKRGLEPALMDNILRNIFREQAEGVKIPGVDGWLKKLNEILPGIVRNFSADSPTKVAFVAPVMQTQTQTAPNHSDANSSPQGYRIGPRYSMNMPYRTLQFQPNPFGGVRPSRIPATPAGIRQATAKMGSCSRAFFTRLLASGRSWDQVGQAVKLAAHIDADLAKLLHEDMQKLATGGIKGFVSNAVRSVAKPVVSTFNNAKSMRGALSKAVPRGPQTAASQFYRKPPVSSPAASQVPSESHYGRAWANARRWGQTAADNASSVSRPVADAVAPAAGAAARPGMMRRGWNATKSYGASAFDGASAGEAIPHLAGNSIGSTYEDGSWAGMGAGAAASMLGRGVFGSRWNNVSRAFGNSADMANLGAIAADQSMRTLGSGNRIRYNDLMLDPNSGISAGTQAGAQQDYNSNMQGAAMLGGAVGLGNTLISPNRSVRANVLRGGSSLLRAGTRLFRGADAVADSARAADRVSDAGRAANAATRASQAARTADGVSDTARAAGGVSDAARVADGMADVTQAAGSAGDAARQAVGRRGLTPYEVWKGSLATAVAAPAAYQIARFDPGAAADRVGASAAKSIVNDDQIRPTVNAMRVISEDLGNVSGLLQRWNDNKSWITPLLTQMAAGGALGYAADGSRGAAIGALGLPAAYQGAQYLAPETFGEPAAIKLLESLGVSLPELRQRKLQNEAHEGVTGAEPMVN